MMSVLRDDAVFEELRQSDFVDDVLDNPRVESVSKIAESMVALPDRRDIAAAAERMRRGEFNPQDMPIAEAIIMRFGYPSLLVQNGTYVEPALEVWRQRLSGHREAINRAIRATGRIEVAGIGTPWLGTGWLIDERTIVTNRHVAEHVASGQGTSVRLYEGVRVSLDWREEHDVPAEEVSEVEAVIFIEPSGSHVDLALMRLRRDDHGIAPIPLGEFGSPQSYVGVIGYPAFDPRNSPADQARIFDNIYEKKRFAPGDVMTPSISDGIAFEHNCTTLGGNSGSVVIDVASGAAVGLHFGGVEGDRNEAVRFDVLRERAARNGVSVRAASGGSGSGGGGGGRDRVTTASGAEGSPLPLSHYAGRTGYSPGFLGEGALSVPLPKLNVMQMRDAARLADGSIELKYQNFSLVMNAARRLVLFSAVNIDGTDLWHKPRGRDVWRTDPRIPAEAQVDNALYERNDFDRGHIVRRLDPVWGDKTVATRAEADTFHYTNATPQHKRLNQGIWVELENHVLDGAQEGKARISVLCGPLFGYADPRSKRKGLEEVGIPLGFWKVIASEGRKRNRRVLHAQAFVIWQNEMFGQRDLERVFGQGFETFQVSVAALERLCGLDFGPLREADTLGEDAGEAASESPASRFRESGVVIRGPSDIVS